MTRRMFDTVLKALALSLTSLVSGPAEGAFYFVLECKKVPPSDTLDVAFSIQFPVPARGVSYSISFDPEALEAVGKDTVWEKPSGLPFESDAVDFNNEDGTIVGSAVIAPEDAGETLPVDLRMRLFVFRFQVKAIPASNVIGLHFVSPAAEKVLCEAGELYCGGPGSESFAWAFLNARIEFTPSDEVFLRGDANGDVILDMSDPIALLTHLFLGGRAPGCLDAADADDSGILDLTDAVYSLTFQFLGGPLPASPYPDCGPDPTPDALGCEAIQCR
jgi:hypothetical protein